MYLRILKRKAAMENKNLYEISTPPSQKKIISVEEENPKLLLLV